MKRILVALLFVFACERPREASEMPHTITPDPSQNPLTISVPSDGDDADATSVDSPFQDLADKIAFGSTKEYAGPGALAAITDAVENERRFVNLQGWYQYNAAPGFTADGILVVTATGMGGGTKAWSHQSLLSYAAASTFGIGIPYIGPTPADSIASLPEATVSGRINNSFIKNANVEQVIEPSHFQYTQTSATPTTLLLAINTPLKNNDIVKWSCNVQAAGNAATLFNVQIWMEYSEDGGSTWAQVTGNGGALSYAMTADNLPKAIPLNFYRTVHATATIQVRLRALSDGTHQVVIDLDSWLFEVIRP